MKKNQAIVLVLLLVIESIIIAGCVTPNVPTNTTTLPTQCPPKSGNAAPYIIIHPIGTHAVGDVFEINGTTNLGVDDRLKIAVNEERPTAVGPFDNPEVYHKFIDSLDYVIMNRDSCGINSWSYQVNLTGFHSRTVYDVKVYSEQNRTIINYSNFFIRRDD